LIVERCIANNKTTRRCSIYNVL